jgi:nucleoside-specific outer membrane channel protein Tsx
MRFVYLLAILLVLTSIAVAQPVGHVPPSKGNHPANWLSLPPDAQRAILAALEEDDPGWTQQAELTASDGQAQDGFGGSVAVSGSTIVVGALSHPYSPGNQGPGAAYVFVQSGGTWSQQAELTASDGVAGDEFGSSVAVDGSTIVVGAPLHAVGSNQSPGQGAAYVFVQSGGTWSQQAELTASDGASWDFFGNSVGVSGSTLVVGAVYHKASGVNEPGLGAAYVFVENGGTWSQQAELTPSDGFDNDQFGISVGVSGSTAVVGAPRHTVGMNVNQGVAYVFAGSGGTWSQQAELTASDGHAQDGFGGAVAISGNTAVVGAPAPGAAYVFGNTGTTWSEQAKLTSSDSPQNNSFGNSVTVSGSTVVVGASNQTVGSNVDQGAAYVFAQSGGTWNQQAELTASDGAQIDLFGMSVAVSDGAAAVGAPGHKIGSNVSQGAAYVFGPSSSEPTVTLSPVSLSLGNEAVNYNTAAKRVTLENTGNATLDIGSIAVAPSTNFKIFTNTCTSTLAAGKSCKLGVEFTPMALGALTASLEFTDNASNSPQTVPLSGKGIADATLTPASATYGAQKVGTTSAAKTFTLANNQPVALASIAISTMGDFAVSTTTCESSLGAKTKCTISVTFTPTAAGTRTGQLIVNDSASNSPQTSDLTGTGK